MDKVQIRVYFDITKKGRGKCAQAVLQLLRERVETAEYGYFSLTESEGILDCISLHTTRDAGIVYYDIGWPDQGKLPDPLRAIKPLRVSLTANGHFNFPEEGLYEEGEAEVSWSRQNTNYSFDGPGNFENSWKLSLTVPTLEEAYNLYVRIREGSVTMKHRWVNKLSAAHLEETGALQRDEAEDREDETTAAHACG